MFPDNTSDHIRRPASRIGNDDADGVDWIVIRQQRRCAARDEANPCESGGGGSLEEVPPLQIDARRDCCGSNNPNTHEWLHVTCPEDCLLISAAPHARRA